MECKNADRARARKVDSEKRVDGTNNITICCILMQRTFKYTVKGSI